VNSGGIVVDTPVSAKDARLHDGVEDPSVQKLILQFGFEAIALAVLWESEVRCTVF